MTATKTAAGPKLFALEGDGWLRNPLSVWTRFAAVPLLVSPSGAATGACLGTASEKSDIYDATMKP